MQGVATKISAAGLAWLALIVVSFLYLDRPIAQFAHDHLRDHFNRSAFREHIFWSFTAIAAAVEPAAVWGLGLLGLAALIGWRSSPPIARIFVAAAVAALIADAAKNELKLLFGRPWPETWVGDNPSFIRDGIYGFFFFHGGDGWASFPSGHTTLVTAPMSVLWLGVPRLRWLAVLLTVLVIVGLIGLDYHFLSDCLAGIAVGTVTGVGVATLFGVRPLHPPPA
jgi:membrane-associated phospholipid phosphatase